MAKKVSCKSDIKELEMTDRELLELAARAAGGISAGIKFSYRYNQFFTGYDTKTQRKVWNPLTDDRDALRLAVKLNIINTRASGYEWPIFDMFVRDNDNPYAATRRSIVRAAAEIGRNCNGL